MVFHSKVDSFFVKFIIFAILLIAVVCFIPLFLEGGTDLAVIVTSISTFVIIAVLILWPVNKIKYVLNEDHLFVKGGPFKSRIPYKHITKVTGTRDIFTGYRILSSKDAIEIVYPTGLLGAVKISPVEKEFFLDELRKRCPHANFDL